MYHVFTTGCLYIYYVHLPNAGYVQHLLFPFPFCHTTSPLPPFLSPPGRPQADGFPLMCRGSASGSFLTNREFFLARVTIVLALWGFQALGSVKRLETIVLLWRYINKIELNYNCCMHYTLIKILLIY